MTKVKTLGDKLTKVETTLLKAFGESDLYDGLDSSIWRFDIVEKLSPILSDQNIGKGILSLEKKGIFLLENSGTEVYITLTDEAQEDSTIVEIVDKKRSKAQEEEYVRLLEEEAPEPIEEEEEEEIKKPKSKKTVKKEKVIKSAVNPSEVSITLVKEKPSKGQVIRSTNSQEGFTTVESTWVDRVERRDFEKLYLEKLGTKYSCEISVVRNKETNKDTFIVIGDEKSRENLVAIFTQELPILRKQAHEAYLASDRSLSEFKFTTAFNKTILDSTL